jgi:hypothetical protein
MFIMKTMFTSMLLIALVVLVFVPSNSFAQAADTVIVVAQPPGNLNTVINGDTLVGGIARHPNRVWLLKPTGTYDTTYYLTATIRMTNLNLVGVTNPKTGHPPVVAPMILADNSSIGQFITITGAGTIYCKNIYFLGTRPDATTLTGMCMTTVHDSSTFRLDHCVFENFGSSGTPNILYTQGVTYQKLFITNCMFRNNQDDTPQNPGMCWMGNWPIPIDTAIFTNNTWFVFGGAIIGGSPYCAYQRFEHNTVFGLTKSAVFSEKQMYNSYIRNNIFYNVFSMGMDSVHVYVSSNWNANYFTPPAVAAAVVDTIINLLANVDSTKTAKGKVIQINNNAYFWHSDLVAAWPAMSAITIAQNLGPIVQPRLVASVTGRIWWDKTTYPGISVVNNDSLDPGFNAALAKAATDSLIVFDKLIWKNGTSGGVRPFIYLSDPVNMFAGVASNWATTQGYPVKENLRYTNTALLTRGTDGKPLGDLNWFPEFNGVSETINPVPTEFAVSQNYPNPFNPSTSIKVSLHQAGAMSLTIYNLLGQIVQVVDQGNKQAGEYVYNVNLDKFGSGVYFYTLRQGNNSISKKMLLLK